MEAKQTRELIDAALKAEEENANKWGTTYSSMHEAYAVLKEEIEEAGDELDEIKKRLDVLWIHVRYSNPSNSAFSEQATKTMDSAINLAIEALQIAAVSEKIIRTWRKAYDGQ